MLDGLPGGGKAGGHVVGFGPPLASPRTIIPAREPTVWVGGMATGRLGAGGTDLGTGSLPGREVG